MYSSARLPIVQTLPVDAANGGGVGGGGGDYHIHHHHGGPGMTLDGTNLPGDACLVLTTDPKPRLRWTAELHERFVDAVTQLGGPDSSYQFFLCLKFCFPFLSFFFFF